ncbi:MAG: ATP-binding cassette domain-containing protein [Hydrotalea sp.]|nr:ATP-binding cassette domain-containing protein [Hydrotalea sp.]
MAELLRLEKINKFFGYRRVLSAVSMTVHAGECHVLLGDTGFSRTALLHILAGKIPFDGGAIYWQNKDTSLDGATPRLVEGLSRAKDSAKHMVQNTMQTISGKLMEMGGKAPPQTANIKSAGKSAKSPIDAKTTAGATASAPTHRVLDHVALLDNGPGLLPNATFIENIAIIYHLPLNRKRHDILLRVNSIMAIYGFHFFTNIPVSELTSNERFEANIVRCLFNNPSLMLIGNVDNQIISYGKGKFYRLLKQWQKQSIAILYSTDFIDEGLKIADEVTLIKQGRWVMDFDPKKKNKKQIVDILNDGKKELRGISYIDSQKKLLVVDGLNYHGAHGTDLSNINFTLHAGEVMGIVGLPHNGGDELFSTLRGDVAVAPAMIKWHGVEPIGDKDVVARRKKHIGFVAKNWRQQAVIKDLDVFDNVLNLMAARSQGQQFGIINKTYIRGIADNIIKKYDLPIHPQHQLLRELSQSDLHKFVLGRELSLIPETFILYEPYVGGDRGTVLFTHRLVNDLVEKGGGVIIMSQDVEEIFSVCDTVYVLANGLLSPPYQVKEQSKDFIESLMVGYAAQVDNTGAANRSKKSAKGGALV